MADGMFDNRQPQPAAAGLPRTRFIHPVETFGQARNMLRRDAWPVILDAEQRAVRRPLPLR